MPFVLENPMVWVVALVTAGIACVIHQGRFRGLTFGAYVLATVITKVAMPLSAMRSDWTVTVLYGLVLGAIAGAVQHRPEDASLEEKPKKGHWIMSAVIGAGIGAAMNAALRMLTYV